VAHRRGISALIAIVEHAAAPPSSSASLSLPRAPSPTVRTVGAGGGPFSSAASAVISPLDLIEDILFLT